MSATKIIREAWQHIWRKPGTLVMAFWYLFIIFLFQLLVVRGLGNGFQNWVKALESSKVSTLGQLPAFPHGLLIKVVLVYLTMFLIIFPFVVGALFGGIADGMASPGSLSGLFTFFRYGGRNFWESLGVMIGALVGSAVVVVLALLVNQLPGIFPHSVAFLGVVADVVATVFTLFVLLYWMAVMLYWMGAVYFGRENVLAALFGSFRWVAQHLNSSIRLMLLNIVVAIAGTLLFVLFSLVPIIGEFFALVIYAFMLALVAAEASILYRDNSDRKKPPTFLA